MPKVAIIGSGLIGRSWAMIFARGGWDVALWDPAVGQVEDGLAACAQGLRTLAEAGLCDDPAGAARRIHAATGLADALAGAAMAQESGPENLQVKQTLFAELDQLAAAGTVLASSTSAFQCSLFTEGLAGRARCVVAHPVNPPHLVPVVELSGAPWTAPETVAWIRQVMAEIGQVPITVLKEVDGFILNRLQSALLTEAFRLVEEGYVSPADLDHTVADGLGLRWALMGPFETIELNAPGGLPDYVERGRPMFTRFIAEPATTAIWSAERTAEVLAAWGRTPSREEIAAASRRRDWRLAALVAHKKHEQTARGG